MFKSWRRQSESPLAKRDTTEREWNEACLAAEDISLQIQRLRAMQGTNTEQVRTHTEELLAQLEDTAKKVASYLNHLPPESKPKSEIPTSEV